MSVKVKGYALAALAAAAYGMNPLFAIPLYSHGMDATSVLFFRYLFALPMVVLMLTLRGRSLRVTRGELGMMAVLGVLMVVSSITLFESYNYMGAGIASTMLFVYPVMVAVIMALVFHERLSLQTALCIVLALSGIVLLYQGDDGTSLSPVGTLLVMASALSYALYIVLVNKTNMQHVATLKVTCYVLLFGLVVLFLRSGCGTRLQTPDEWYWWGNLLALALFPTVISFACTTSAIQYIGSTPTAILGALEPVTAIFFGVTLLGEALTVRECVGIVVIIVAVTLVVMDGVLHRYMTHFRKLFPRLPRRRR